MKTVALLLSLSVVSVALIESADAQTRLYCRTKCGYVYHQGTPNVGKVGQTPQVNACYRTCMGRARR
jgi:hypothetical protein